MRKEISVFEVDQLRQRLAKEAAPAELERTYDGSYPEMEDISTAKKWDKLLVNSTGAPNIRIQRLSRIVQLIQPPATILDVGVGWGDIVPLIQEKLGNVDYTGIDFSKEKINELKQKYPQYNFHVTGADKIMDQGQARYDYVLVLEVLEHIVPSRVFEFLRNIKAVMKDTGMLIVSVPYKEDLSQNTFICSRCESYVNKNGHVRSYSANLLRKELEIAGLIEVKHEFLWYGYQGLRGLIKKPVRNFLRWIWDKENYRPIRPTSLIAIFKNAK